MVDDICLPQTYSPLVLNCQGPDIEGNLARYEGDLARYAVAVTGLAKHGSHLEAAEVRRLVGALSAGAMPAEVSWGCGSGGGLSEAQ